jgi:transcriptional regulator GlxA family with amidase domain
MHDFTILALSGASASSVALTVDILSAAETMAPRVGTARPTWQVRSVVPGPIRLGNGMSIEAKPLARKIKPDTSTWVIPGLATTSTAAVDARLALPDALLATKALRAHARAGGTVAASCSGVFLLQAAELLRDTEVTTTWWLAAHLQRLEPQCTVDANRLVIADGAVWTAGAALAQTDLMLQLIRVRFGAVLADAVSRVLLIDGREAQSPFIVPSMLANGNSFVADLSKRISAALPRTTTVASLAAELSLTERTLARRVKAATGSSPSALIQLVRLNRARQLLENSRLSVAQVAEQVGYGDPTALRRLMRRVMGASPRQFRPAIDSR